MTTCAQTVTVSKHICQLKTSVMEVCDETWNLMVSADRSVGPGALGDPPLLGHAAAFVSHVRRSSGTTPAAVNAPSYKADIVSMSSWRLGAQTDGPLLRLIYSPIRPFAGLST